MRNYIFILFLIFRGVYPVNAAVEFPPKPNPPRLVNDYTGTLDERQKEELESRLLSFHDTTSVQIAVVILSTLDGYPVNDYAFQLAEQWGIGQQKTNNGALLLIVKDDRKLYIATGYGLEGVLPDALCKRIIENDIKPFFREGNFYEGLLAGTGKMMDAVKGEYKEAVPRKRKDTNVPAFVIIFLVVILVFVLKVFSVRRYSLINSIPFWTAWQLLNAARSTHSGSWGSFNSGSGGFGGGSSGGFGGFGGGSFGGGGAGGSW